MASEHVPELDWVIREFSEDMLRRVHALERMVKMLQPVFESLAAEEVDDGD